MSEMGGGGVDTLGRAELIMRRRWVMKGLVFLTYINVQKDLNVLILVQKYFSINRKG